MSPEEMDLVQGAERTLRALVLEASDLIRAFSPTISDDIRYVMVPSREPDYEMLAEFLEEGAQEAEEVDDKRAVSAARAALTALYELTALRFNLRPNLEGAERGGPAQLMSLRSNLEDVVNTELLIDNDPRGPIRKITEVGPEPGVVRMSCNHVQELNPIYTYRVGDDCRCFPCRPKRPGNR